jgi:hypothetical protein
MFRKKESKPPAPPPPTPVPFTTQILTTEYLIEGLVDAGAGYFIPAGDHWSELVLSNATMTAVAASDIPPRTIPRFIAYGYNIVAVIQHRNLEQISSYNNLWKKYKAPKEGIFYFGPYRIRGKLVFPPANTKRVENELPMINVQITAQSPASPIGTLTAPFIFVNTRWMFGYEPV